MVDELAAHYGEDLVEASRLSRSPHGRLELLRTQELVRRELPAGSLHVLDVGGGTGVHAAWLAADGHRVHLVDVVPSHVRAAAALPGVTAEEGDARRLTGRDASVDVVLLLGPLYHLVEAEDRARALAEARRVLRPGGLVAAAGISRYLSLMAAGADGTLGEAMRDSVRRVIDTGRYDAHVGFVTTHFHGAEELAQEVSRAGFVDVAVYGVEGPSWPALDAAGDDAFGALCDAALRAARLVERDPHLVHASAHLLAMGRAPAS